MISVELAGRGTQEDESFAQLNGNKGREICNQLVCSDCMDVD